MKILVISESSEILESYSDFFTNNGFETICYSWLLKALDNILEIKPDSVVVNTIDYPRHWKTLVQYVRSVYEDISSIILITPSHIEEDEQKKIDALNVYCVKEDFNTTDESNRVLAIMSQSDKAVSDSDYRVLDFIDDQDRQKHVFLEQSIEDFVKDFNDKLGLKPSESESDALNDSLESDTQPVISSVIEAPSIDDSESETIVENNNEELYFQETSENEEIGDEIFENDDESIHYPTWLSCPLEENNETILGKVLSYEHPILKFSPNNRDDISYFHFGKKIESCTLTDDGYPSIITVQVQGFEDDYIELCIVR